MKLREYVKFGKCVYSVTHEQGGGEVCFHLERTVQDATPALQVRVCNRKYSGASLLWTPLGQ